MRRLSALFLTALILTLALPALASAHTVYVYPGAGVGSARLSQRASTAKHYMSHYGSLAHTVRDRNYSAYTVYRYDFGKHLSGGRHQVAMYVKKSSGVYRVFAFQINSGSIGSMTLKTKPGIKVGSTTAALTAAYSTLVKGGTSSTPLYTLRGTHPTYFYVRYGKVSRILLSK
jgi:hypothetical protein